MFSEIYKKFPNHFSQSVSLPFLCLINLMPEKKENLFSIQHCLLSKVIASTLQTYDLIAPGGHVHFLPHHLKSLFAPNEYSLVSWDN